MYLFGNQKKKDPGTDCEEKDPGPTENENKVDNMTVTSKFLKKNSLKRILKCW